MPHGAWHPAGGSLAREPPLQLPLTAAPCHSAPQNALLQAAISAPWGEPRPRASLRALLMAWRDAVARVAAASAGGAGGVTPTRALLSAGGAARGAAPAAVTALPAPVAVAVP